MQLSGVSVGAIAGVVLALAGSSWALSPEESLQQIALDPRLELQLWAAEPQVLDPVAIAWDEFGAAYVAECRDYPYGAGPGGKTGSAVRRLIDTNGDGRADQSTLFADGLSYVTSLTPHREGLLVVAPPEILWLRDTNQDGVADQRTVVLTGLHRGISDSLANGLRFGWDSRFHVANGGSSGTVSSPLRPDHQTALKDYDFAFRPETGEILLTGATGGGFGLVFDDFGRAFTPYNISHIQHRFLPLRAAQRFPGFPSVLLTDSISDHGEMSRIFPISTAQTRPNHPEQAGHFSAAGGMGFIGSELFPEDLAGSVLVGDAVGNLIHRDVLHPDGPVFRASRAPQELDREFLASRDPAFRPVAFEVGPDGALYVLDMQRDVIEHPDYIPEKLRRTLDIRAGDTRGRVYRVVPRGKASTLKSPSARIPDSEWVNHLGSSNQWWRTTAQRVLTERGARDQAERIRHLAGNSPHAPARVSAWWTLHGLGELKTSDLLQALQDSHPGVRENAYRLVEDRLPATPALHDAVLNGARDPSARVRFITAQTLGALATPAAVDALETILEQDFRKRWSRLAVWSSVPPEYGRRLAGQLLSATPFVEGREEAHQDTCCELAALLGARSAVRPDDVSWLIEQIGPPRSEATRRSLWEGLAEGLERSGTPPPVSSAAQAHLAEHSRLASTEEMRGLWRVTRILKLPENEAQRAALTVAFQRATNASLSGEDRVSAVRLLALGSAPAVTPILIPLLDARQPVDVQQASLEGLRALRDPDLGTGLVNQWRRVSPAVRTPLLNLLLERRAYHEALVLALEEGRLQVGELNLDLEQRRRLLRGSAPGIQKRAAQFMGDEEYSNRKTLVTEWLTRLPERGDPQAGRKIFAEACAKCHVAGELGHRVGPDLTGVAHRSVEDLLSNILDPNMAINPGFVTVLVETQDGEVHQGLIESEAGDSVTLLLAEARRTVIPRSQIVRVDSSGQSLMPEGLEAGRTPQQLRDLIAFLQGPN
ncbi:MAG: HEAT repeat domain-containing protein [Verrucomicrobia bacterium]|nr:HEAT repeat domain-containing protein [Verrucomicrobiota bacterium]